MGASGIPVAIYARYSSDLQREASIEDQIRICEDRARQEGWVVAQHYTDHAVSGASLIRPGIQGLLQDAIAGRFQIVLAESIDRLSRDQEDIAGIFKRLSFAGVQIITLAEGEVSELHIGLKGTMGALFLKDLADKTRRGLRGVVAEGRSGGGNSYGYDVVRNIQPDGKASRGARTINQKQAAVIKRIFAVYAEGASPRAIARKLNDEGIAGPSGKAWGASTIHGNKDRGTGILNNELYIGRLVWNRLRYIKDPTTGKRVSRLNPSEEWVITDVPALRIIDQTLWDRVKARQASTALGKQESNGEGFWDRRRPRYLLSGLIKCGACGSGFVKISREHFGCAAARNKGTCSNMRTIRRDTLEETVLGGLQNHLMDDEMLALFCEEYTRHINTLRLAEGKDRARDEGRLSKIDRETDRLIDAIADGVPAHKVKDRMIALEAEADEIRKRLDVGNSDGGKPLLHPQMGARYREAVQELSAALNHKGGRQDAIEALRSLIDRIVLNPDDSAPASYTIDIEGDLAGILNLCRKSKKAEPVSGNGLMQIKLVAGARNYRYRHSLEIAV